MPLVVITGGNRGIGWELAHLYSAAGWDIVLGARSAPARELPPSVALATDLEPEEIAVAALHPGWARTDTGGPRADIEPKVGAEGVKAVLDTLTLKASGKFWNYDGSQLDW